MQELTPEQIKEEEHKCRKRAWNRTYWRRRKEREQAAKAAKEKELSDKSRLDCPRNNPQIMKLATESYYLA